VVWSLHCWNAELGHASNLHAHACGPTTIRLPVPAALRVMEVREAYAKNGFEWEQLQRLTVSGTQSANVGLLRKQVEASLRQAPAPHPAVPDAVGTHEEDSGKV
jgi:hypothetical protein